MIANPKLFRHTRQRTIEIQKLDSQVTHNRDNPPIKSFNFLTWNRNLGNPMSHILEKPVDITHYQQEYHDAINTHHKVIIDKTKKGGFTEGFLRHCSIEIFKRYAGHEIVYMAGNKASIALDGLRRLNDMFEFNNGFKDDNGKRWRYGDLIEKFNKTDMEVIFYNNTKVKGVAASIQGKASPVRGLSDVVCWFLTEAAHTGAIDDTPVFTALTSLTANRDYGDEILESTPNGRGGGFYDYWKEATGINDVGKEKIGPNGETNLFKVGPNGYYPMLYDYNVAVKAGVISKHFIEGEKKKRHIDFEQEYEGLFTTSKGNAYEPVNNEDYTDENSLDLSTI